MDFLGLRMGFLTPLVSPTGSRVRSASPNWKVSSRRCVSLLAPGCMVATVVSSGINTVRLRISCSFTAPCIPFILGSRCDISCCVVSYSDGGASCFLNTLRCAGFASKFFFTSGIGRCWLRPDSSSSLRSSRLLSFRLDEALLAGLLNIIDRLRG